MRICKTNSLTSGQHENRMSENENALIFLQSVVLMAAKPNARLNLEDIAQKAGVSRATVSRVVNNHPHVKARTREHVMQIITQEGYSPNLAARALVTRRMQTVGIVIPHTFMTVFEDQYYFPTLLHGMAQVANQRDYAMMIWVEDTISDPQRLYDRITKHHLMDGLIIASYTTRNPFLNMLRDVELDIVLVERPQTNLFENASYVTIDNVQAAAMAVQHLIDHGYQRIATLTGELTNPDGYDRFLGYQQTMHASDLGFDPDLVMQGDFARTSGRAGMAKLIPLGVDAVFAANDQIALGALDAIEDAGLCCPHDVAIIGFDDLPSASSSRPPLTTVHQPVQERGAIAMRLLLDQIEGLEETGRQVVLPTELIIRESCGTHA